MKKALSLLLAGVMCVGLLAGCGGQSGESQSSTSSTSSTDSSASTTATSETSNKKIDTLRIAFVPSREPEEIITATEPLKQMLTDELATLGYDVGEVDITVGTSYEAVGEALAAGTADVGLIPGGTYVLYDDGCDVLLTATRDGLSIDSDSAKDWNDNAPTEPTTEQVTSYRALMIAGPSEKGKELAAKVNAGEALTWEDVSSANWSVANSSSPAGYIYPSLWLHLCGVLERKQTIVWLGAGRREEGAVLGPARWRCMAGSDADPHLRPAGAFGAAADNAGPTIYFFGTPSLPGADDPALPEGAGGSEHRLCGPGTLRGGRWPGRFIRYHAIFPLGSQRGANHPGGGRGCDLYCGRQTVAFEPEKHGAWLKLCRLKGLYSHWIIEYLSRTIGINFIRNTLGQHNYWLSVFQ